MSDIFDVMIEEDRHSFQVLTKRPGRALYWWRTFGPALWPANVWLGTSVESQKYAPRLSLLGQIPARIVFVSAEPLLGPLDLRQWLPGEIREGDDLLISPLSWVIAGGESGPRARDLEENWLRDLRDQVTSARVPFFLKQLGGRRDKRGGDDALLDGRLWREMPDALERGHGKER